MGYPDEGDTTSANYATLSNAQNKFNDLAAAFRNAIGPLQGHESKAVAGAGQFADRLEPGAAKFLLSWREAFTVCEESAGLVAGNIGATQVNLKAVDIDASTAITL